MKHLYQSKQKEHGQSMVELALTFTVLMVLLAGTVDLGRAFFTWIEMRDAAQEGASFGSICPTKTKVTARVQDNLNPIYTYTVTPDIPITPQVGDQIKVTVITELPLTMPFLGTILGKQFITIKATINDTILTSTCTTP